jgi:hypothetical protein
MEMVLRKNRLPIPSRVGGGGSNDTKKRLFVSFDSSVTVLRSDKVVVGFVGKRNC